MAVFTWKQAMKLSKVKSFKMNKIIAQPFGKYAVVTNIFYDLNPILLTYLLIKLVLYLSLLDMTCNETLI